MRIFTAILKNNLRRLRERKSRFFMFVILTAAAIAAALFINTKAEIAGHIAVVSHVPAYSDRQIGFPTEYLNVTVLKEEPPMSELVSGKYDAVVIVDEWLNYKIKTIKSDDFKHTLESIIADPTGYHATEIRNRGNGTNIVGFMLMFIFMQGVSMMFMFAEDKEKKQISRITASPISFTGYLCGHTFFAFAFLVAPIMLMLTAAQLIFRVDMGFDLRHYLGLISLISALATSFAIFLIALFRKSDTSNMLGSAIVTLTSLLAGGFYSFDKGNRILETAIKVLPQKAFLSMADLIERGKGISSWYHYGLYIVALTIIFFAAAIIKTRKDYVKNA